MSDISYSLICAVRSGRLQEVSELISNFGLSYSEAWSDGYVLLLDAIEYKRTEVAKLLLTNDAKVNSIKNKRTNTPLHGAVRNGCIEIVEMLLDRNAGIDAKDKIGRTPLDIAIDGKKMEMIELLLNRGCGFSGTNCKGAVLRCAIETEYLQLVERLLNNRVYADFAYTTSKYMEACTPLCLSVKKGNEVIIKLLLSKGANIDASCGRYHSPLHIAAVNGHVHIVKLLLENGAYIECLYTSTSRKDCTPLYLAVEKGHVKVVELLLEKGANVDAQDKNGNTILRLAIQREHLVILEVIFKYCPDMVNKEANRGALNVAVLDYKSNKNSKIVESMIQYGFTINLKGVNNCTLLHAAVEKGFFKIVKQILQYGVDVNMLYTSSFGNACMPLHVATRNRQEEIAKLLISYAADVNAKDIMGKTPIFYAIENADLKITKLLLSNKADVNGSSELLNIAVQKECREIVEILLQYGADINAADKNGRTALHISTGNTRTSVRGIVVNTKMLLSKGANINAQQKDGCTALHLATHQCYTDVVEVLLRCGAKVNLKNKADLTTPLHIAVQKGYIPIVEVLLKFGADIDSRNINGKTALHIASYKGYTNIVTALINYGSDINICCKDMQTPLDYAKVGMYSYHETHDNYYLDDYHYEPDYDSDDYRDTSHFDICRILDLHIVKMQTANLYVKFKIDSNSNDLKYLMNTFKTEVARMKSDKINNANVSFYDILTKGINRLALYAKNKNIIRGLRFDNYKRKFPMYANMIQSNFMKGKRRKELLEQSCEFFYFLFNNFPDLPYNCTEKIFSYLNDEDLQIFLNDFRKREERKDLLEQCNQFFYFKYFPHLPFKSTDKISSYLNDEDLRILIVTGKPTNISFNPNID